MLEVVEYFPHFISHFEPVRLSLFAELSFLAIIGIHTLSGGFFSIGHRVLEDSVT
jgi:hypothetical protein